MAANYKNPPIWAKFGFQVDYDVTNWYSSLGCNGGHFEFKMAANIQKSSDLGEIWFPSILWSWEFIAIVGLLWRPLWIQNGRQNTKILRFWAKFGFQVDYDVANWYPSFGSHIMILKIILYLIISCYVLTLFFIHTTYLYCSFGGYL